jgi:hypothetical protein
METKTSLNHENPPAAKPLLGEVKLILLYDYNVVAKEVITIKLFAYLRGFFWKYNILFHLKRDFIVVDA